MNGHIRSPKIVRVTQGVPPVPEPHPADYSSKISDATIEHLKEVCPQDILSGGRTIKRFEW